MKTTTINCHDQTFTLHPSGAIYWGETDMVLIADVHFGKVSHFRKHGSAVPRSAIYQNFEQLNAVLSYFNPRVLCFLGDLFHSYINNEWILFRDWIKSINAQIILITGNHDIISTSKYEELNIHVHEEWQIGTILLTHHPECRENAFNLAGHIHPGVRLKGMGRQSLTTPCFFLKPNQLILPAFGVFTGKYIVTPQNEEKIYAIAEDEVLLV